MKIKNSVAALLFFYSFCLFGQEGFFKKISFDTASVKPSNIKGVYPSVDGNLWLINGSSENKGDGVLSTLTKTSVYIDPIFSAYLSAKNNPVNPNIMAFAEANDRSKYFFIHLDDNPTLTSANSSIFLAKFDDFGNQLWAVNLTPQSPTVYQFLFDARADIIVLPNQDIVVQYSNFLTATQRNEKVILCLSPAGQIKWSKTLGNSATQQMKVLYNPNGNEIIWSGYSFNNVTSQSTIFVYHIKPETGEPIRIYSIQGLVSQIPVSMHLTSQNYIAYLTNGNGVILTNGEGQLNWAFAYRDNEISRPQFINAISMNANALGIIINRRDFQGSEVLKIDRDGEVLFSRRYHSFILSNGLNYPGFSNTEIYAPAQAPGAGGLAANVGMVHLHEDLSVTPCEREAFCFEKTRLNVTIVPFGGDLINFVLQARTLSIPEFSWIAIASRSEEHCTQSEKPLSVFQTPDTVCVGEFLQFTDLKNEDADSSQWKMPGGSPFVFLGKSPSGLIYNKSGTYTIRHVMKAGCRTDSTDRKVVVLDLPLVNLPDSLFLCEGHTGLTSQSVKNATELIWNDGITTFQRPFPSEGEYTIAASNYGFCTVKDTLNAKITTLNVDFDIPPILCANDTIQLLTGPKDINPGLTKFEWKIADTSAVSNLNDGRIILRKPGTYNLTLKALLQSCADSSSASINILPAPAKPGFEDTLVCTPPFLVNFSSSVGAKWIWNDGDTTPNKRIDETGIFTYSISEGGCTSKGNLRVDFIDLSGEILADSIACLNDTKMISYKTKSDDPETSFSWTLVNNSQSSTYTGKSSVLEYKVEGRFLVILSAFKKGCVYKDTAFVLVSPPPILSINNQIINLIDSVILIPQVDPIDAIISWEDGSSDVPRWVNSPGIYRYDASVGDCFASGLFDVRHDQLVFIPNVVKKGGDAFKIAVISEGIEVEDVFIYDRFGNLVHHSYQGNWDTSQWMEGVYAYLVKIRYPSGEEDLIHGDITLLNE
ncbi:MAG: hypothetical protein KDC49_12065 [Saprospiraceae bacterium]|nr:hypothetical protein [Saprospiraceae bacterium]